ncbi:unnamed protein product [Gongylonema pulchrum]|uniref:Uncharacterized protein n=1 Tax=Gongylonema pulchrum TaxID=637853 RepID=A0A3P7NMN8_9BILA|nr:unnamed protein product [Gongylonema pulchrum]
MDPVFKRRRLIAETIQRLERKSATSSPETVDSASIALQISSASRNSCNATEARIEVLPANDHRTDGFLSDLMNCSRRGISLIGGQLETVPEETSGSTPTF